MTKAKPYLNGSFPRQFDKHEPPQFEEIEYTQPSSRKTVRLTWYVKKPLTGLRKILLKGSCRKLFKHYTVHNEMVVETRKKKFKNRRAALNSIESEKRYCQLLSYQLVNYKIEEL